MKFIFRIIFAFLALTTTAQAQFSCVGGQEACAKERVLYRLQRLTGESCAGGYEACKKYLEDRLSDIQFEQNLPVQAPAARGKRVFPRELFCIGTGANARCLKYRGDATVQTNWINPRSVPSTNFICYLNRDQKAFCTELQYSN